MNRKLIHILVIVFAIFKATTSFAQDTLIDNFNDSTLSSTIWEYANQSWSAGSASNPSHGGVVPALINISNGVLALRGHGNLYTGDIMGIGRKTKVGSCVISKSKHASGRYEFRAKIIPRAGDLSAFWTFDFKAYSSVDSGNINHEIDIEVKQNLNAFNQALCNTWIYEKVSTQRTNNNFLNQDDGNYHIYRFDWHTGGKGIQPRVEFYYDDVLKETITTNIPSRMSKLWIGNWFPSWVGTPDFAVDTMFVDWVKIIPFHESNDSVANPTIGQTPYYGNPFQIPVKIQAEDFDNGSEGIAYHDLDAGNTGKVYRLTTDVDIEKWTALNSYALGYVQDGEWVEYTINVPQTKKYDIILSVASKLTGGTLHIEIDGTDISGPVKTPGTGGWGIFQELWVPQLQFPEGLHVMRMFVDKGDFNLDYLDIREVSLVGSPHLNASENMAISIYPNPCSKGSTLNISINEADVTEGIIDIYDMTGNLISNEKVSFSEYQATKSDIRAIAKPGIYLMRFLINKKIYWKKLSII
jgi:beta-glucanase (GH16 family)